MKSMKMKATSDDIEEGKRLDFTLATNHGSRKMKWK